MIYLLRGDIEVAYLFKGLIKCIDCGKNYRGVMERKIPSYVCSGFTNYGKEFCQRFKIKEGDLLDIVKSFYEVEIQKGELIYNKNNKLIVAAEYEELAGLVAQIEVSPKNQTYVIYYTNGLKGICKPDRFSLMDYAEQEN